MSCLFRIATMEVESVSREHRGHTSHRHFRGVQRYSLFGADRFFLNLVAGSLRIFQLGTHCLEKKQASPHAC